MVFRVIITIFSFSGRMTLGCFNLINATCSRLLVCYQTFILILNFFQATMACLFHLWHC